MTDPSSVGTAIGLSALAFRAADKMISPAAERIGLSLFRVVDSLASYQEENVKSVLAKWADRRDGRQITDEELRKTAPLLPLAAKEDDDDLQTRWAALLESVAISPKRDLLPFGHTLSQLSPDQAKFLDVVYDNARPDVRWSSGFSLDPLVFKNPDLKDPEVLIDALERLGLIRREVDVSLVPPPNSPLNVGNAEPSIAESRVVIADTETKIRYSFIFTGYAVRFVEACRGQPLTNHDRA